MRKFLIVIEKSKDGYGAYSPDLPGCVAVGNTRDEVEENIYEAISLHIEGMLEDGLPIPESESSAEFIAVPDPV